MVGGLLPVLILLAVLIGILKKRGGKNQEIKIKYDKKLYRIAVIAAVSGGILLLSGILFIILFTLQGSNVYISDFAAIFPVVCLYMGGGVFFCGLGGVVECFMYFRRLKAYGYEIPEDKKQYDLLLKNLPMTESAEETEHPKASLFAKHSRVSSVICVGIQICLMICAFLYYRKWNFMRSNAEALLIMLLIADLFWILPAIFFYLQGNIRKYRDDVENDITRKARMNLEEYLFVILFLFFISFMIHNTADSMTNYIFKSKIQENILELRNVQHAVKDGISVYKTSDSDWYRDFEESYKSLCEGVDITQWGVPSDLLQKEMAARLFIDNFEDLRKQYELTEGEPQIIVKIEGDDVIVKINNPISEVKKTDYVMEIR